jgi:hypothetical protein
MLKTHPVWKKYYEEVDIMQPENEERGRVYVGLNPLLYPNISSCFHSQWVSVPSYGFLASFGDLLLFPRYITSALRVHSQVVSL